MVTGDEAEEEKPGNEPERSSEGPITVNKVIGFSF